MKRVVMLRSNPVNPDPRLEKMANSLSKMNYEVTVLAWDRDDNYSPKIEELELIDSTVKIIRIGIKGEFSGGFKKNAVGLIKFEKFIYTWLTSHVDEYDIIHAYDFDCGYTASKVAIKYNKRLVYDIADYYIDSHGMKGSLLGRIVENREIFVINHADATIICSEERSAQISKAKPKKTIVIHNTPNIEDYNVCLDQIIINPTDRLKLVYVGILSSSRYIDKIVEVVSHRKDCEFHVGGFGGGLEPYFEECSQKYDNIYFYGRIPYQMTIALEKECDVMCAIYDPSVPNHKFAAPNKFYEALAIGKPLIMANGSGMSSIVKHKGLGEVIDYNEESLECAIDRLIRKKKDFYQIGETAKKEYEDHYSWKEMESRIEDLYSSL